MASATISRRRMLFGGAAIVLAGGLAGGTYFQVNAKTGEAFKVSHSKEEWRKLLTDQQFAVLREEATERAFSSPLNDEKREGTFHCAGCDQAVFASADKFDSGTGWPSFTRTLPEAVAFKSDYMLIFPRTEEHCSRCGGHLGHVFDDGPPPTGKRHCINGVAMTFKPA
ncbi:peptide-methionine (R)-S-oxide reductase [Breoghania corrubedonensis]|uniref:peptide-methionine (R)-S-oxide reductase n=1 Tax=Breoghania corrubedonensis TaxID=665038 RepID=A0A2T5VCQ8_9HYPH|nr:peptide-methionine (R)-S-oxide reductase MsrB [Breoghania corrubedonensis]PTW61541.1 peptide-methionine (R)-S-oxide reductase [Breoghania corrubedonensis]